MNCLSNISFWKSSMLAFVVLTSSSLRAQEVNEVVAAEKSFSASSERSGMRQAFLQFSDDSAITFQDGVRKGIKKIWEKRKESPLKLVWQPLFAAASGDLGITTGPWQFKNAKGDSVLANGTYTTVWKKNDSGEWRFIVDLGNDAPAYLVDTTLIITDRTLSDRTLEQKDRTNEADLLAMDKAVINLYETDGSKAFTPFLLDHTWLNSSHHIPAKNEKEYGALLAGMPSKITMIPLAGGISSTGKLAYIYGFARFDKTESAYLRIWQRTEKGWRILLQVLPAD